MECARGLLLVVLAAGAADAQAPARAGADQPRREFKIIRLDPALDAIISPNATLETLGEHFGLTEGPVWVQESPSSGHLLFSDLTANVIYKRTTEGRVSVFAEDIVGQADVLTAGQQTRSGRMATIIIGSNGLTLDRQGRVIAASPAGRVVLRFEKDGTRTVLADRHDGRRFNGPNDVAVKSNGAIYFTDGNSGLRGGATSPAREMALNGVFLIKDGTVTLLDTNADFPGAFPNGITLSPDERQLYVTFGRKIVRYDVQADDRVANRREFLDVAGNDGMKTDRAGNLYSTTGAGPGEVRITSAAGTRLGTIQLPDIPGEPRKQVCATNVGFGDPDGKGLYITACNLLFRLRLNTPGVRPGPLP
jgi:gluconolactonase